MVALYWYANVTVSRPTKQLGIVWYARTFLEHRIVRFCRLFCLIFRAEQWHYPDHQALILGISSATTQLSGLAAYALVGMVQLGLSLSWGFIVLAGFALIAAVMSFFSVPSQEEFFEYAEAVLQTDIRRPDVSIVRNMRGTLNVMWQYKGATAISFICIGLPFMLVVYWVSILDNYLPLFTTSDQSNMIFNLFTILLSVIGGGLLPLLGGLMDKIGSFWFYALLSLSLGAFVGTVVVQHYVVQIVALVSGIVYQACWLTFAQRWAVYFAPPDLIGSYMGLIMAFIGICAVAINLGISSWLAVAVGGIAQFTWPLAIMGGLSVVAAVITLIYIRAIGVPAFPPEPSTKWAAAPAGGKTVN